MLRIDLGYQDMLARISKVDDIGINLWQAAWNSISPYEEDKILQTVFIRMFNFGFQTTF